MSFDDHDDSGVRAAIHDEIKEHVLESRSLNFETAEEAAEWCNAYLLDAMGEKMYQTNMKLSISRPPPSNRSALDPDDPPSSPAEMRRY